MPPPQASGKRREFDPLEVNFVRYLKYLIRGGGGGIRTRDTVSRIHTFQACAFDRSATPPSRALMKTGAGEAHSTGRGARASRGGAVRGQRRAGKLDNPAGLLLGRGARIPDVAVGGCAGSRSGISARPIAAYDGVRRARKTTRSGDANQVFMASSSENRPSAGSGRASPSTTSSFTRKGQGERTKSNERWGRSASLNG